MLSAECGMLNVGRIHLQLTIYNLQILDKSISAFVICNFSTTRNSQLKGILQNSHFSILNYLRTFTVPASTANNTPSLVLDFFAAFGAKLEFCSVSIN